MGLLSEVHFRALAYVLGLGEFAGNVFRNLHAQVVPQQDHFDADLVGKTAIITGSNAGIGLATATELSRRGCRVILACRSLTKAQQAAKEIQQRSPQHGHNTEVAEVSLSSLDSVKNFCKKMNQRQQQVDLLILNAGIMGADMHRKVTADGLEQQFQVNYLSHWLMAHELLGDQIRRRRTSSNCTSKSTRVVFLSSSTHVSGNLDLKDLQLASAHYSGFRAYTSSKLAMVLAAKQMQRYLDRGNTGDTAVAVHPGMVQTKLAAGWLSGSDVFLGFLMPITAAISSALAPAILEPAPRAAKTVLYAALAPASEVKGKYVAYSKVRRSSKASYDPALAQGLWDASLKLTGVQQNAVEEGS